MPVKHMPAHDSPQLSTNRIRESSPQLAAHNRAIASIGGKKSGAIRSAIAKRKKLSETKIQKMVKQMILHKSAELVRAAMIPAMGQHFIYEIITERNAKGTVINKKHELLSDPERIGHALDCIANEGGRGDDEDEYYYASVKEPDFRAVEMLMNRGIGKVAETKTVDVNVKHFSLIGLARERSSLPAFEPLPTPVQVLEVRDAVSEENSAA